MTGLPLWTSAEADAVTGGRSTAAWTAHGVSIDTRSLAPGDLFVALKGDNRDGHAFLAAAFAKGAAAALVAEAAGAPGPVLQVADTLDGLRALGRGARARSKARIAAITGSVGKTSTKDALRAVLGAQGITHGAVASYNNHWGVPLTLARMPAGAAYGVFEIGMNHAGEIAPLSKLVAPHVAIVTTVEPVHIEFFPSVEAIAEEKGDIFAGLVPGGTAIVNRDNAYFTLLRGKAERFGAGRVLGFGAHREADARLVEFAPEAGGSRITAVILGRPVHYRLAAPGRHMALNSLAVLAAAEALGADLDRAGETLAMVASGAGRGARFSVPLGSGTLLIIDESYNANPASMRAALELLRLARPGPGGRRVAILGDMLELGTEAPRYHADLDEPLMAAQVDRAYLAGPLMRHLWERLPAARRGGYAESAGTLLPMVIEGLAAGDVVMIKGSFGSRMGLVVEALKARAGSPASQT